MIKTGSFPDANTVAVSIPSMLARLALWLGCERVKRMVEWTRLPPECGTLYFYPALHPLLFLGGRKEGRRGTQTFTFHAVVRDGV